MVSRPKEETIGCQETQGYSYLQESMVQAIWLHKKPMPSSLPWFDWEAIKKKKKMKDEAKEEVNAWILYNLKLG